MSIISESQRGITILEMLIVLAVIGVITGLVQSFSFSPGSDGSNKLRAEREFVQWHRQIRINALYSTELRRVCFSSRRVTQEIYNPVNSWEETDVFYLLPPRVRLRWVGNPCSHILNTGENDALLLRLAFHSED